VDVILRLCCGWQGKNESNVTAFSHMSKAAVANHIHSLTAREK